MREPLPLAVVVHATAGRTRLRIASRRGDAEFFTRCAGSLAGAAGVVAVEARALTASLLVHHDDAVLDGIAAHAERTGLFMIAAIEPVAIKPSATKLPPPPALAALLFGALGLFQLNERRILPPALTLFWYAATLAQGLGERSSAEE